jgi:hypothetical protein
LEDQFEGGRLEGWKVGAFERRNMGTFERWAGELRSVHDGEPPFVSNDNAGMWDSAGKVLRFRGQSYKFPPRIRNPQFGEFPCILVRKGVEGWKYGRMEGWNVRTVGMRGRLNVRTWKRLNVRPMRCAACMVVSLPSSAMMIWIP